MSPEDLKKWEQAGKAAAQALDFGRKLIKSGTSIREVCDKIDQKIRDLGARPAWPTQIGLNHIAAHATPDHDDDTVFKDEVVCLDVGAHVDGFVGDNACSVDLGGQYPHVVKATQEALEKAIKIVRPGITLDEIGRVIQDTIEGHGVKPVHNLSGHGISQWIIHDAPSVPNIATGEKIVIKEGQIIALEPFASTGGTKVVDAERANIFALLEPKSVRSPFAREVQKYIVDEYGPLPFTTRWLTGKFGIGKTNLALRELVLAGALHQHPPLYDPKKGMIAVTEKTLYVGKKVKVLTEVE